MTIEANNQAVANTYSTQELFDLIFPIGIIYKTTGAAPALGTWELYAQDRVVIGTGGSYTLGQTGGAATELVSAANMPAHSHPVIEPEQHVGMFCYTDNSTVTEPFMGIFSFIQPPDPYDYGNFTDGNDLTNITVDAPHTGITIANTGSGARHENMQRYIAINRYRRTA